jgi:hypothetical protein
MHHGPQPFEVRRGTIKRQANPEMQQVTRNKEKQEKKIRKF